MSSKRHDHSVSAKQILRGESEEIEFIDEAYTKAVHEWDQIQPLQILSLLPESRSPEKPFESIATAHPAQISPSDRTSLKSKAADHLEDFTNYVNSMDLNQELPLIRCHINRSYVSVIFRKALFIGSKPLKKSLRNERNCLFALALRSFDNSEPIHFKMLASIYRALSASSSCPRTGCHWEKIGFQGTDPASDLRGVGILGLYQLSYFVLSKQTSVIAQEIYALSTRESNHFPFCVMGLNITQIALQLVREGVLNREMNRRKDPVLVTFNLFYASLYLKLYLSWKENNFTIVDTGFVLKNLRKSGRKSVHKSIVGVTSYQPANDVAAASCVQQAEEVVVFSDIGDIIDPNLKGKDEFEENLV